MSGVSSLPWLRGRRMFPVSFVMKPVPRPPAVASPRRSGRIDMVSDPAPPAPPIAVKVPLTTRFTLPDPLRPRPRPRIRAESCPPWLENAPVPATVIVVGPLAPPLSWIVLAPLLMLNVLIVSLEPALFAVRTSVPPASCSVPAALSPSRSLAGEPVLSMVRVPPVFTL